MNAENKSFCDDVINSAVMKPVKRDDDAGEWRAPILAPKPFCLKSHVTEQHRDFRLKTSATEDEDWFRDIPLPPSNLCPSEKSLCSRSDASRCITAVQSSGTTEESMPPLPPKETGFSTKSCKEGDISQLVEKKKVEKTDAVRWNGNEEARSRDASYGKQQIDDKKKMMMRCEEQLPPKLPPKQLRFDRRATTLAITKQQKTEDASLQSHPGSQIFNHFNFEDKVRSKSLIEEPLAPIKEEEDSSKDDLSMKTESGIIGSETWSPSSSHQTFTDEDSIRTRSLEEIIESRSCKSKVMFCLDGRSVDPKISSSPKDVTPYGMVDLTKFEGRFQGAEELTPSSIMSSVHDFNSTLSRKNSLKTQNVDDEVPSFPLKIESKGKEWRVKNRKCPEVTDENIGYDNLEKYKEIESSTKETRIKDPTPRIRKQQTPSKHQRLSRHSSAVTALDRHSNHLKRTENNQSDQIKVEEVSAKDPKKSSSSEDSLKISLKIDEKDKKSVHPEVKKIETEEEVHSTPRSLGSQLRNFLSGNSENKYISPSLRRKRSLLKRSKSPGGSRRSQTPPRSLDKEEKVKKKEEKKISSVKEEEKIRKERSASQRIVDRRGRHKRSSFRRSEGDLEEKKISDEKKKKSGSRWRRSKSQDRSSPSRCSEKQLERSKSTERTMLKTSDDPSEDRGRSRGNIFKRSRSSSRKREVRGKSSERKDERGRNPVNFIRKLLKKKDFDNEEDTDVIIQVSLGETRSHSGSSEALNAILAYKSEDIKPEKGSWTPPRPSPALQRAINTPPRKSSPKYSLSSNSKETSSSHEGILSKTPKNLPISKNFTPKSFNKNINNSVKSPESLKDLQVRSFVEVVSSVPFQNNFADKENLQKLLQKPLLASRDYDSDTSIFVKNKKSSLKKSSSRPNQKEEPPRRPVRLISPKVSRSFPCLLDFSSEVAGHTYYNLDKDEEPTAVERKILNDKVEEDEDQIQNSLDQLSLLEKQRRKYKMIVSLNNQTLKQVSERWLVEWKSQLPVGGFLITSWSDLALTSHQPICMINNSVVYGAVSNGNNKFNLACQLFENRKGSLQNIERCINLPSHPNVCGICSHFVCRLPRSLLDPSSGGGAADVICIVLSNRPSQIIEENLNKFRNDTTEFHRQILLNILQILHGIKHLLQLSFPLPEIRAEHIINTTDLGFVQILPHLALLDNKSFHKQRRKTSESVEDLKHQGQTQQLSELIKYLLQKASENRNSITSKVVVPGTKYSSAIKQTIQFLHQVPTTLESLQEAAEVIQCALWGPEDLEDESNLSTLALLELWIEVEQAKLVNSLAVMVPGQQLVLASMLKHRFLTSVTPEILFNGLKILQRI